MALKVFSFLALFTLLTTNVAQAQVAVQGIFRTIKATERPIENIQVHNTSDEDTLQIKVEASHVTFLDGETETLTPATDLKFAPTTFVLTPKSNRIMRIFKTTAPDNDIEKLYRIHLKPSQPNKAIQEELNGTETKAQVKIITSMGVLLAAAPKNIKPAIEVTRTKGKVTLKNTGNITLHLRSSDVFCQTASGCYKLRDRYFPPNRIWTFDVPSDNEFTYFYEAYGEPASLKVKAL